MGTIATLAINIIGNIQGLEKSLSKAQESLKSAGDNLTNLGGKLTAGVSLPILGVGGAALKAAADNEQLQVAFTTMLGSADKATALMKDLSIFAAATPFESDEIQGAAKMLLAYGSDAGKVTDEMRQLGDIAAGVGVPLKDMAYLYGTARVQGRLFTADINQFTSRGVPIMEALSATMGVATSEIRGMVEEGKVGFPELQAALAYLTGEGGKFNGLMEAQSTTLSGLFSTLKDNVSLAMIDIGNAIAQAFDLKTNAATAITFVEGIRNAISDLAKTNPQLLRTGVIIAAVAAAVGPALVGLGVLLKTLSALTPVISVLGSVLTFLVSPLGLVVAGLTALVVVFATDFMGARTALTGMVDGLLDLAGIDLGGIVDGLQAFGSYLAAVAEDGDYLNDWLTHLPEPIQPAVLALGQLVAAVGGLVKSGDLGAFVQSITSIDWGGALGSVGESLNVLRDGMVAALGRIDWAGALASAGDWLNGLKDGIVAAVTAVDWGGALTAAGEFLAGLRDGVIGAVSSIDWGGALATVGGWLDGLKNGVIGAIQTIPWGEALTAAGAFLDTLKNGVVGAITSIDWGAALTTAGDWLANLWGGVVAAVTSIPWLTYLGQAGDFLSGLTQGVVNRITTINWGALLLAAGDYLAGLWGNVANAVKGIDWAGALASAGGWLDNLKNNIVAAIQGIDWAGALSGAGEVFATLETAVAGALAALGFSGAATSLDFSVVTANFQAFVDSVGTMGADLGAKIEAAKTAIQPLIDFLEPSFSRLAETVMGLPEQFGALGEKFGPLGEAAGALGESLGGFNTIGVIVGITLSFLANTANAVLNALTPLAGTLIDQLTTVLSGLAEIVNGLVTAFQGIVNNNPQQVLEGLGTAFQGVKDIVTGTFASSLSFIAITLGAIGAIVSTTLSDWGFDEAATAVGTLVSNVTSLLEKIKAIASGDVSINFAAPDWIVKLLEWLWPSLEIPDAVKSLLSWQWPSMSLPELLDSLLGWKWPDFPSLPDWVDNLMAWEWPSFDMPDWLNNLFNFQWPAMPELPWWLGGENKAVGTSYFSGGFVNASETTPEMAILPRGRNWLPRGTQILNGRDSAGLLAGAGGGGVTVIIQSATIRSERDVQRLAREIDDIQERRRRS